MRSMVRITRTILLASTCTIALLAFGAGVTPMWLTESQMLCVPSSKRVYTGVPVMGTGGMVTFGALLLLMTFWFARRRVSSAQSA